MKLTEELLNKMEQKKELYGDGIIMPDGDYRLIQDGHLKTLMSLLPYTENELWKMIPEDDSALFWLGIISGEYYDLTKQREKTHARQSS